MKEGRRVVVTGMGGITALGDTWEGIEGKLRAGVNGVRRMPDWDRFEGLNTRLGAPVDFTPPAHYPRKMLRSMGRVSLLSVRASAVSYTHLAQAIAAQVSLGAKLRGVEPKLGALLGSSNFRSAFAAFSPQTPLAITACLEFRDDSGLGAYECRIEVKGTEVASATLKVFEPENFDQFIATGTTTS